MLRLILFPLLIAGLLTVGARAASLEILASFQRPGSQVAAPLLPGADGNFYGTAPAGGAYGLGTVFRLSAAGTITTLHSFSGADGQSPVSALAASADGSFVGVTPSGGTGGFGTLFRISSGGIFTHLLSFTGTSGAVPGSVPRSVVITSDGTVFGVTRAGGSQGAGTVFRYTSAGVFTSLVSFTGNAGSAKGAEPVGLTANSTGTAFYGVTAGGGTLDMGTVFSMTSSGALTTMVEFTGTGTRPGAQPDGPLLLYNDSTLYGTTFSGGTSDFGTLFRLTTAGTFTSLRSFADATGSEPRGAMAKGADGNLYGATSGGGTSGFGTLYRMTTAGVHTVLGNFTGTEGLMPGSALLGGLTSGGGTVYGITSAGGPGDLGVAFSLSNAGTWTKLTNLSLSAGWTPSGAPVADGAGGFLFPMAHGGVNGGGVLSRITATGTVQNAGALGGLAGDTPVGALLRSGTDFYGVCAEGGTSGRGTAFRFNTAAALVANYTTTSGSLPAGPLLTGPDGALYGVGREGGTAGRGTIYRLTTAGVRTRLVSFTGISGAARGTTPLGPLALAANTSYYGMTAAGGAQDQGTLFRMNAAGSLTTLAEFTAGGPRLPGSGLVLAADGFLYGILTSGGTHNAGALLRVNPASDTWTTVADFQPATTGAPPSGPLLAAGGAIYGMTATGSIYKWTTAGGLETVATFTSPPGESPLRSEISVDGLSFHGGLALHPSGTLYGTLPGGGPSGGGVVFRISMTTPLENWKLTHLGDANAPDLGDPDQDGITTLVEYATGSLPGTPGPTPISMTHPGTNLLLTVTRNDAATDVTMILQCSDTLATGSWQSVTGVNAEVIDHVAGVQTLRYTLPPAAGCRFYRFIVSRAAP